MELEKQDWYWNITLLTLGMAILVIVDLLYDFPAAPLTKISFGTSDIQQNFAQILVEYIIFYGLVGFILFAYTLVLFTLVIFGLNSQLPKRVLKIMGYMVVLALLVGTMSFDLLLFYNNDSLSNAFWNAARPITPQAFGAAPP
jgi:hypothetical protein